VVHLEVAGVDKQVVDRDTGEVAGAPGVELASDLLTDPADGRLADRGLGSERLAQRRFDVAIRQARTQPEITNDSSALVRVTCLPSSRDENVSRVPRTLGRLSSTAPAVVLMVVSL
jgi:hypothetical protein